MYNFKSTLLILLLGIILIVPAIYCFTLISPSLDRTEKGNEGQSDRSQITIDVIPPTKMNDTVEDSSIVDEDTSKEFATDDDVTSEDSSTADDDAITDTPRNDSEPSSNGTDAKSWPVIMIVEDDSGIVNAKSQFDSRRLDESNNWLIVNKRTSIRRVEEDADGFGKSRKVLTEDKNQELRVYRDNFHTSVRNGIDLTNILRL